MLFDHGDFYDQHDDILNDDCDNDIHDDDDNDKDQIESVHRGVPDTDRLECFLMMIFMMILMISMVTFRMVFMMMMIMIFMMMMMTTRIRSNYLTGESPTQIGARAF